MSKIAKASSEFVSKMVEKSSEFVYNYAYEERYIKKASRVEE